MVKKNLETNFSGRKKFYGRKNFRVKKIFGLKKCLGQKNVGRKIFFCQKNFGGILGQNFLGKKFLG